MSDITKRLETANFAMEEMGSHTKRGAQEEVDPYNNQDRNKKKSKTYDFRDEEDLGDRHNKRNKNYDDRDDYKPPKDQRPKTDPPPEKPVKCFKCDSYNHKPKDCWHDRPFLVTAHPDINTNPKLLWKNSPAGIKYMKVFPKAAYLYRKCPSTDKE